MALIGTDVYVHRCRTVYGNSSYFEVKAGVHQGSALSPLLFEELGAITGTSY